MEVDAGIIIQFPFHPDFPILILLQFLPFFDSYLSSILTLL